MVPVRSTCGVEAFPDGTTQTGVLVCNSDSPVTVSATHALNRDPSEKCFQCDRTTFGCVTQL
ncbi:hypothetical protein PILCRDRAFT_827076 [Piloderma croceum F 1598]|uniref:Uncharacterized protein n=1 Tax=Piloderma croceum (strain F 1598) TaxID=765440 RepID=A0A0C3F6V4_PILCF|nr:hypothetical protein PILCRDRAFT_827076 [Piloderma croceum F 1598]